MTNVMLQKTVINVTNSFCLYSVYFAKIMNDILDIDTMPLMFDILIYKHKALCNTVSSIVCPCTGADLLTTTLYWYVTC